MQIIRNTAYVKDQQRRGRILTTIGFVALAAAFVMVWVQRTRPELILVAYALMLFGFVFFNMGLQSVGKFISNDRKKRADELLDRTLDKLNDRYTIIHYAQIGKRAVEHLIVHSGGVLVITMREVAGKVIVNERRWRKGGNPLGRFFNYSGPQLGNPSVDNELDVEAIKAALTAHELPNEVEGVIVFSNPLAEVSGSAPIDVLGVDGLLEHVRLVANDRERPPLTLKERTAIIELLAQGLDYDRGTPNTERRKRPVRSGVSRRVTSNESRVTSNGE
ncbi:MAG: nuclease-related domain-containing protein [Chloroflexia bacterium]